MDHIKPKVDEKRARSIAMDVFGLCEITEVKELMSNYDVNFLVKTKPTDSSCTKFGKLPDKFVLKILNAIDSQYQDSITAEIEAMDFLRDRGFPCPEVYPVKESNLEYLALIKVPGSDQNLEDSEHVARLIAFLNGNTIDQIGKNRDLLYTVGRFVGSVSQQLKDLSHRGIRQRTSQGFKWNILEFLTIENYISVFTKDEQEYQLINDVHNAFMTKVKPQLHHFRSGTVHNDMNGENILVTPPPYVICGLIDFGDMVTSLIISELSNSMAHFMDGDHGIEHSGYVLAGYQAVFPLPAHERKLLYYFIAARLCQLVLYSKCNLLNDPNQVNVQKCLRKYYGILVNLWGKTVDEVEKIWSNIEVKN